MAITIDHLKTALDSAELKYHQAENYILLGVSHGDELYNCLIELLEDGNYLDVSVIGLAESKR